MLLLLVYSITPHLQAADGSSGCGPGWYVFKDNSFVSSFLRAVTNNLLSPIVTLGMTFGTSNCAKHSLVKMDKQSEHFATVTFDKLRQEVAQGSGVFIEAYTETFQCDATGSLQLTNQLQRNYAKIFQEPVLPETIVKHTLEVIKADPTTRTHCRPSVG